MKRLYKFDGKMNIIRADTAVIDIWDFENRETLNVSITKRNKAYGNFSNALYYCRPFYFTCEIVQTKYENYAYVKNVEVVSNDDAVKNYAEYLI